MSLIGMGRRGNSKWGWIFRRFHLTIPALIMALYLLLIAHQVMLTGAKPRAAAAYGTMEDAFLRAFTILVLYAMALLAERYYLKRHGFWMMMARRLALLLVFIMLFGSIA